MRSPDRVAVRDEHRALTYAELSAEALALASRLRSDLPAAGTRIGVHLNRTVDVVVAILAITAAGHTYVPLDPGHPPARLAFVAGDSGVSLILVDQQTPPVLASIPVLRMDEPLMPLSAASSQAAVPAADPDTPAYVLYTSGSTGRPKGVQVLRRNVRALILAVHARYDFTADDVWMLFHSYSFDFSVWEMWGALSSGATLVVVSAEVAASPRLTAQLLIRERVTVLNVVPSVFRYLVAAIRSAPERPSAVRRVILGGETIDVGDIRAWRSVVGPDCRFTNAYGVTECTVIISMRDLPDAEISLADPAVVCRDLGQPLNGWEVRVVDPDGLDVGDGETGEICVAGDGVSVGYLNRPDLTRERFRLVPGAAGEPPRTFYHTGDLAVRAADRSLHFAGRSDDQVKVNGHRIELGEVEFQLRTLPGVRDVAVLITRGPSGAGILTAYFTADADLPGHLGEAARTVLPAYMIPGRWVQLDALPRSSSGKVDRLVLAEDPTRLRDPERHPGSPDEAASSIPLSVGQEAIWLAWTLDPEHWIHIIPTPFEVAGAIDSQRMRNACAAVGDARPHLRGRVRPGADGLMLTWSGAPPIEVLEYTSELGRDEAIRSAWQRPFDLRQGPLARVDLIEGSGYRVLVIAVHHLVYDGASILILLEALIRAYGGAGLPRRDDAARLRSFALRSRELVQTPAGDADRKYWQNVLTTHDFSFALPASDEAPQYVVRGESLDEDLAAALRATARRTRVSYVTVLLSAYFAVLRRHCRADELIVFLPHHGRAGEELHDVVGFFVNLLPICVSIKATHTYADLLSQVSQQVRDAVRHGSLPLPEILRVAGLTGPTARARAQQTAFQIWDAATRDGIDVQRLQLESPDSSAVLRLLDMESSAGFPLTIMVRLDSAGTHVLWKDPGGVVGPGRVARLAADFQDILRDIAADPLAPVAGTLTGYPADLCSAAQPRPLPADGASPAELAAMATVWEEVLGVTGITGDDSFFELGGHSLLAEQLVLAAGQRFSRNVATRTLFDHPFLSEFTPEVLRNPPGTTSAGASTRDSGARRHRPARTGPVTPLQQHILLAEMWDKSAIHNVFLAWTTSGKIEIDILRRALRMLVEGHEILRTGFGTDTGSLVQMVGDSWQPEPELLDLSQSADPEVPLAQWLDHSAGLRFDLASGRLLRVAVADLGMRGSALLVCVHHLVIDGGSVRVLLDELNRYYLAARTGTRPAQPARQYLDFVRAQLAARDSARQQSDFAFWRDRLAGAEPFLNLPGKLLAESGKAVTITLPPNFAEQLRPAQASHGVSWFMVFAAALFRALHIWTGHRTVTVGALVANRERPETQGLLGPCLNTVILRSDADPGQPASHFLSTARHAVLDALEHSNTPFEEVVLELDPERRIGRIPYVDVQINMNLRSDRHAMLGDALLEPLLIPSLWSHDAEVPLSLTVMEENGKIAAILSYQGHLVAEKDVLALAAEIANGLTELVPRLGSETS